LAERRNEIAHGAPSELLNTTQLEAYLDFFEAFGRSALAVLRQHLAQFLVGHSSLPLGVIKEVHYRKVVCLDTGVLPEGTRIEVGDIVALRLDGRAGFNLGEILRIRTESGDVQHLRTQRGLNACLETNLRLREGKDLYLVSRENPTALALYRT